MRDAHVNEGAAWARSVLTLAVVFGVLGGLAELVLMGVKRFALDRTLRVSRDVFWMAPLADVALCLIAAMLLIGIGALWPRVRRWDVAVGVTAFPVVLTVLLHYRPVHFLAKVLLAAGLATQAAFLLALLRRTWDAARRRSGVAKGATADAELAAGVGDAARRRLLAGAGTTLGGLFLGTRAWSSWREWRALPSGSAPAAPNVLLVVLDTVRAASLSLHGYPRHTTPNLERYAARGVVFDRAYTTSSWTLPSHASMFTGRWSHELTADWDRALDDRYPTIAEVLRDAGWHTGGFVANTFYGSWEHGLSRGFARYEDYRRSPEQVLASSALGQALGCATRNEYGCRWRDELQWYELLGRKPAAHVLARFLAWLDDRGSERPFFAFLNLFDAHAPYLPPAPFDTLFANRTERENPMHLDLPGWRWTPDRVEAERTAYDGAIAYLDNQLGRLFETLEARGVLENTLVIVTSDHGEEFMEHGVMTHGNTLYGPSLHVPLVFMLPGSTARGRRVPEAVSLRDVPATILDVLGMPSGSMPGRSLRPFWEGEGDGLMDPPREPLLARLTGRSFRPQHYPVAHGDMESILSDGWHYIRRGDGKIELYRIQADPWEMTELQQAETTIADSLSALLRRARDSRDPNGG
ncbi:MAG TPA: sulfatase [Gemmatimonadaceae bacterium]|nr:sulfatase [Gemmatimonadaceae bacterium]